MTTTKVSDSDNQRSSVLGACPHDCPDTCSMVTTVENGQAIALRGNSDHSFTGGTLCGKVDKFLARVYSPDRILYPLRRVGSKGSGQFERISWDVAPIRPGTDAALALGRRGKFSGTITAIPLQVAGAVPHPRTCV